MSAGRVDLIMIFQGDKGMQILLSAPARNLPLFPNRRDTRNDYPASL
jgi:hypothetical protein